MPPLNTLRHRRRLCGGVLLFVLLALMPMRGWADVAMHLGLQAGQTAQWPAIASEHAAIPPCHAAMPDDASATCPLCALCHSLALCETESRVTPVTAAPADTATVPEGHGPPFLALPERPPRH